MDGLTDAQIMFGGFGVVFALVIGGFGVVVKMMTGWFAGVGRQFTDLQAEVIEGRADFNRHETGCNADRVAQAEFRGEVRARLDAIEAKVSE